LLLPVLSLAVPLRFPPWISRQLLCMSKDVGPIILLVWQNIRGLREQLVKRILKKSFVIGATCTMSGSEDILELKIPVVLLDEAAQCSEPEALISVVNADQVMLLLEICYHDNG